MPTDKGMTFPFYNDNTEFKESVIHEYFMSRFGIGKLLSLSTEELVNTLIEKINREHPKADEVEVFPDEKFSDWLASRIKIEVEYLYKYEFDVIRNDLLKIIEKRIESNVYGSVRESLAKGLDALPNENYFKGNDLVLIFKNAKKSLLGGEIPRKEAVDILFEATCEDKLHENYCSQLMKYYGLCPKDIRAYFSAIDSFEEKSRLEMVFTAIGVLGMKLITSHYINKKQKNIDSKALSSFRTYCNLHCMYLALLKYQREHDGYYSLFSYVMPLMEASFLDGKVVRENEFYTEDSMCVMSSHGTSAAMRAYHKNKDKELYDEALAIAESLWENGSILQHNKMADEILEMDKFKGKLKKTKLLRRLREEVACKYKRVAGE